MAKFRTGTTAGIGSMEHRTSSDVRNGAERLLCPTTPLSNTPAYRERQRRQKRPQRSLTLHSCNRQLDAKRAPRRKLGRRDARQSGRVVHLVPLTRVGRRPRDRVKATHTHRDRSTRRTPFCHPYSDAHAAARQKAGHFEIVSDFRRPHRKRKMERPQKGPIKDANQQRNGAHMCNGEAQILRCRHDYEQRSLSKEMPHTQPAAETARPISSRGFATNGEPRANALVIACSATAACRMHGPRGRKARFPWLRERWPRFTRASRCFGAPVQLPAASREPASPPPACTGACASG